MKTLQVEWTQDTLEESVCLIFDVIMAILYLIQFQLKQVTSKISVALECCGPSFDAFDDASQISKRDEAWRYYYLICRIRSSCNSQA